MGRLTRMMSCFWYWCDGMQSGSSCHRTESESHGNNFYNHLARLLVYVKGYVGLCACICNVMIF